MQPFSMAFEPNCEASVWKESEYCEAKKEALLKGTSKRTLKGTSKGTLKKP